MMRLFHLQRNDDETGVSGVGKVAEGVVFSDGTCALRWVSEYTSTAIYSNITDLIEIHGHKGSTSVVFEERSE